MKKILNKIGQVLQVVLAAPVKWPGKVANVLKYIALGLGIVEKVLEEDKPPPEKPTAADRGDQTGAVAAGGPRSTVDNAERPRLPKGRSDADEVE